MRGFKAFFILNGHEAKSNGITLRTRTEAVAYAQHLFDRWTVPTDWDVRESDTEPNYEWDFKRETLVPIEDEEDNS